MPAPGANLSYHNPSRLWEMFFYKMGMKARSIPRRGNTVNYNSTADVGTTFPRQVGIAAKYSATAPTTNTAADAPTGIGDICLQVKSNTGTDGLEHILHTNIVVFRCTAYTNTTTFTWTSMIA